MIAKALRENINFMWIAGGNKSVCNYDRKLDEKIRNHLQEIDRIVAEENQIYLDEDLEEKGEHLKEGTVTPRPILALPLCA